jgi:DNA-directed RNA polymerase specialized sigma24 family protein
VNLIMADKSEGQSADTTERLQRARGFTAALQIVFPKVYNDLRRFSQRQLSLESRDLGVSGTDVTHDTFVSVSASRTSFRSRTQAIAVLYGAIRHQISNLRRKVYAKKRGGDTVIKPLENTDEKDALFQWETRTDLERFDVLRAIDELALQNQLAAKLIKFHYLGRLSIAEAAALAEVPTPTAKNLLRTGRLWIEQRLTTRP